MNGAPAIGFHVRTSPTLVVASMLVAVLAIAAVWMIDMRGWLRAAAVAAVAGYAGLAAVRLVRPPLAAVLWRADGGAELHTRGVGRGDGRDVLGAVQHARVLGPLIVLSLRWPPRESTHLWILPDNLDADTRRRLRMRLGRGTVAPRASGNADSR